MLRNKKTMKIGLLTGALGFATILAGCQTNKTISEEEQKKIIEELNVMVSERKDSKELEDILTKNIKNMDKESASEAINSYIYSLYNENADMISKMNYLGAELEEYAKENELDLTQKINLSKINDGLMKGFIQEVYNNHLSFKSDGSSYFIVVDMQYVKDKYGKYMTDDLKAYTEFRIMEDSSIIFNSKDESFNLDEITKRLNKIETEAPKWEETNFKDQWNSSKEYYYAILFGLNHSFFIEEEDQTKIKDYIMAKYEEIIKNNEETEFGKELNEFVELIKKSDNKISSEADDYRLKLMEKKFPQLGSMSMDETSEQTEGTVGKTE